MTATAVRASHRKAVPRRLRAGLRGARARAKGLDPWLLAALFLTACGLAAALVLTLRANAILGFGDSTSHVITPRRVLDGTETGFRQLGVHWLPLFHVLQLPFVWVDPLFRTGASGTIVSVGASLLTALYSYRLALLVGRDKLIAFLAAVLLASSPNFLFMGVIPMQAATIMAASTANIYYLTRWALEGERTGLLLAAGLLLSVTTLSHFDTWPLVPLELAVVMLVTHRRGRLRSRTRATGALWLLAGAYGLFFFMMMNVLIFGRPTAFLGSGIASGSAPGAVSSPVLGVDALVAYPTAAWFIAGPTLTVVGLVGTVLYVWHWRRSPRHLIPLLLFYPITWYTFQALVAESYIAPADSLEAFGHVRYSITILPALAFFAAVGIRWRVPAVLAAVAVLAGAGLMVREDRVASWIEAREERGASIATDWQPTADWFAERIGNGRAYLPVLDPKNDRFELLTGLPPNRFIDANDSQWRRLGRKPWLAPQFGARWLLRVGFSDPARFKQVVAATNARECFVPKTPGAQIAADTEILLYTLDFTCPGGASPKPSETPPYPGRN